MNFEFVWRGSVRRVVEIDNQGVVRPLQRDHIAPNNFFQAHGGQGKVFRQEWHRAGRGQEIFFGSIPFRAVHGDAASGPAPIDVFPQGAGARDEDSIRAINRTLKMKHGLGRRRAVGRRQCERSDGHIAEFGG